LSDEPSAAPPSLWSAFAFRTFALVWGAGLVGNIGAAMFDTSANWFMTTLNPSPEAVTSVQVALNLSLFLFTLPAGALADLFDARRIWLLVATATAAIGFAFALAVQFQGAGPAALLVATFLLGATGALSAPPASAVLPMLVSHDALPSAISLNGVGYSLARSIGPALAGLLIGLIGVRGPFWIFAVFSLTVIAALTSWRRPARPSDSVPAERFISSLRTGVRYAANNSWVRSALARTCAFFIFASAYMALLPLVARGQVHAGASFYGVLMSAVGVGAMAGSLALEWFEEKLGPDHAMILASAGMAFALILLGLAPGPLSLIFSSALAGACATLAQSLLYLSTQYALPDWVRGRGLALFLTTIYGCSTLGSAVWGALAGARDLRFAFFFAAGGLVVAGLATLRLPLQTGKGLDLSPALHWRTPITAMPIANDQGPVMVQLHYRVLAAERQQFLENMKSIARERRRNGAYAWGLFEDIGEASRFTEVFLIESWLEFLHLRQRETVSDELIEKKVNALLVGSPDLSNYVAPERAKHHWRSHNTVTPPKPDPIRSS
jgi:MFS family permease